MSLRAGRNVSAGLHWSAGRTLRTNGLEGLRSSVSLSAEGAGSQGGDHESSQGDQATTR